MKNLQKEYDLLYSELSEIKAFRKEEQIKITQLQENISNSKQSVQARYSKEYQIIEDDTKQVYKFLNTARKYSHTQNKTGTIAQPDFYYMRSLDFKIDDTSTSDPYAEELVGICNGALQYLHQHREDLKAGEEKELRQVLRPLQDQLQREEATAEGQLRSRFEQLLYDGRMQSFAEEMKSQHHSFIIDPKEIYDLSVPSEDTVFLKFGAVYRPFPIPDEYCRRMRDLFGVFFDPDRKMLRLPIGIVMTRSIKMRLLYPDDRQDKIKKLVGGLLFNILRHRKPLPNRVYFLDAIARNRDITDPLEPLVGNPSFIAFSDSAEEDVKLLRQLVVPNSPEQYYLFLRGYPDYFSSDANDLIRKIAINSTDYQVTVISVESANPSRSYDRKDSTAFAGACVIEDTDTGTFFQYPDKRDRLAFGWYTAPRGMTDESLERFREAYKPVRKENRLFAFSPLPETLCYTRGKGRDGVRVPIGYDSESGDVISYTFGRNNAFGFLMGGTGSGKSSLLHVILTGVITHYHPDDVELWLCDFNRVGFMQYKTHQPPHLRYMLLDTSPLYCYSFIDKLTDEFEHRKIIFAKNGWEKIEQIPVQIYMPVIFVVLDEFDMMSQAIQDDELYKEKLQNIVTKGGKFGFRVLFCTQAYTTGSTGLTSAARKNLNTRMAMYSPDPDEAKMTIDLPGMSEKEKQMIQNIKPRHVLYKRAKIDQSYLLNDVENFYLNDKDMAERNEWVDQVAAQMKPCTSFEFTEIESYQDKKPVLIDGISEARFIDSVDLFASCTKAYRAGFSAQPTDKLLYLGNPCAFDKVLPLILKEEERENVLLFCNYLDNNARYLSEVMASALRSANLAGLSTEVWAPPKDICLHNPEVSSYWSHSESYSKIAGLVRHIHQLRKDVENEENEPKVIAVFNMPKLMQSISRDGKKLDKREKKSASPSSLGFDPDDPFADSSDPLEYILQLHTKSSSSSKEEEDGTYDALEDLQYLLKYGPEVGIHFIINADSLRSLKDSGCKESDFRHVVAFKMNAADAFYILDSYNKAAQSLPEGVFLYTDRNTINRFVPYSNEDLNNKYNGGYDGNAYARSY